MECVACGEAAISRYKLSLRDLPEMFLLRGIEFTYEILCGWTVTRRAIS